METPAAAFIEIAIDGLKAKAVLANIEPLRELLDALKELREVGHARIDELHVLGHLSPLALGYLLGLETARVMVAMGPGDPSKGGPV